MKALLAAILSAFLGNAHVQAAVITLDFEDQTTGAIITSNLHIGRFRFSPNSHYDLLPPSSGPDNVNHPSQWIGFDGNGCCNQNYLGTRPSPFAPVLWVDYSGTPFTFLGLDPVADMRGDWSVTSSSGGSFYNPFDNPMPNDHVDFSGAQWTNIRWLLFRDVAQGGFPVGFDNITFRVPDRSLPEPGTMLLVGLGLASIAIVRRKRRLQ